MEEINEYTFFPMEEKEMKDILVKFLKDIEEEICVTNFDETLEAIDTLLQSLENKDKEIKELKEKVNGLETYIIECAREVRLGREELKGDD